MFSEGIDENVHCQRILTPVDDGLYPTYYQVIEYPMDLGTIKVGMF